eukprot:4545935-Heterocapsa_arctica.AAC.1
MDHGSKRRVHGEHRGMGAEGSCCKLAAHGFCISSGGRYDPHKTRDERKFHREAGAGTDPRRTDRWTGWKGEGKDGGGIQ